ncbi:Pyrroline-5-carboxylate reductase [Dickeya dianthicola]|uniref:3-hydroxyisobutyrate dehydrogenase n=1 Tax=Dickeya dianthicola TaxID=204039 RepID=A0AAP2GF69_9GAMM|nr:NAD(P)-binding domain-containing protein [Dickeya dianthicola]ATO34024.1 putative polyketide synthase [Dickeya dianthicola RNS04.9]AYC19968.1 Pyrroline-5-carboxylate reductase [Dickeya dianthicola]MBI0439423.1 3-hydroxyisobutyrate dehydrogenase [Dickeya dianthicola]MBI0449733.1 3-hydroxyisobutyrate dehydrogenase [Dickeya dianthicola]MBI0454121.1 3-hydroxyisobutyrate dehydrogenase [Dickeya dianthicola]
MKIGIIGAGNIGATLAHKLSEKGHVVKIANSRGPETIAELARKVGAVAVERQEAVREVDLIILSTPFDKHADLAELLRSVPDNVIVIDTSNYYPFRDGDIQDIREGKPESVYASEVYASGIVNRPLIKAWNAVLSETLKEKGLAAGSPSRIAIPVAGDSPTAKSVALELVNQTGFDAVDAGTLSESWRQQPGTPAYCTELNAAQLEAALQAADKKRAPLNRDELIREFTSAGDELTHDVIVKRNRAVTD